VLFEHGHRLIAATVGLLTFALALWYRSAEPRRSVRRLAYLACVVVILQGLLGGVTVLLRLPITVSVAHACLAQAFFCLVVALALVTSPGFLAGRSGPAGESGAPAPRGLAAATAGLIYAQLILGAVMRHSGAGLAIPDVPLAFGRIVPPFTSFEIAVHFAHRVGALLVAAAVIATAWCTGRLRERPDLSRPALLAVVLVLAQIVLGAATVLSRLSVVLATTHVVMGALLLATVLVLAVRASRGTVARPRPAPMVPLGAEGAA
jgi:cytochrome c oxidase assembly protein subunit 15